MVAHPWSTSNMITLPTLHPEMLGPPLSLRSSWLTSLPLSDPSFIDSCISTRLSHCWNATAPTFSSLFLAYFVCPRITFTIKSLEGKDFRLVAHWLYFHHCAPVCSYRTNSATRQPLKMHFQSHSFKMQTSSLHKAAALFSVVTSQPWAVSYAIIGLSHLYVNWACEPQNMA